MIIRPVSWIALFCLIAFALVVSACVSPVWYDDAGHYLVVTQIPESGFPCYPVDVSSGECDPQSQFITMGPALTWLAAGWAGVFGPGMLPVRMLVVVCSLVFLFCLIRLVYALQGNHLAAKAFCTVLITSVNLQFLTYGAEFLGEVPMLLLVYAGLVCWIKALHEPRLVKWFAGAGFFWALAVLTKEYILLPLVFSLALYGLLSLLKKEGLAVAGVVVAIGLMVGTDLLYHWIRAGSLEDLFRFLEGRGSYGSEFFAFSFGEPLRFLLFKPLVILGMGAMLVKIWFRPEATHVFLFIFQLSQLAMFLVSAGYDRFGFQLIFLPALYLSEFLVAAWQHFPRSGLRGWASRLGLLAFCAAMFSQKSIPVFYNRITGRESNENEMRVANLLAQQNASHVFTYDQQIAPFLPETIALRLSETVPSAASGCRPLELKEGEFFVAGPYGFTEYPHCVRWQNLEKIASTPDSVYQIFRQISIK